MGNTAARIMAEAHGLDDYPVVDEERGKALYEDVIRLPGDYADRAALVLVRLGREVEHMSRPDLERALLSGGVISVEAIPTPSANHGHLIRLQEGGPRRSEIAYLRLPGDDRSGEELGEVFEAVTDPSHPDRESDTLWGVSHYTPSQFATPYREPLSRLHLYDSGDTPRPDKVTEAAENIYA